MEFKPCPRVVSKSNTVADQAGSSCLPRQRPPWRRPCHVQQRRQFVRVLAAFGLFPRVGELLGGKFRFPPEFHPAPLRRCRLWTLRRSRTPRLGLSRFHTLSVSPDSSGFRQRAMSSRASAMSAEQPGPLSTILNLFPDTDPPHDQPHNLPPRPCRDYRPSRKQTRRPKSRDSPATDGFGPRRDGNQRTGTQRTGNQGTSHG